MAQAEERGRLVRAGGVAECNQKHNEAVSHEFKRPFLGDRGDLTGRLGLGFAVLVGLAGPGGPSLSSHVPGARVTFNPVAHQHRWRPARRHVVVQHFRHLCIISECCIWMSTRCLILFFFFLTNSVSPFFSLVRGRWIDIEFENGLRKFEKLKEFEKIDSRPIPSPLRYWK